MPSTVDAPSSATASKRAAETLTSIIRSPNYEQKRTFQLLQEDKTLLAELEGIQLVRVQLKARTSELGQSIAQWRGSRSAPVYCGWHREMARLKNEMAPSGRRIKEIEKRRHEISLEIKALAATMGTPMIMPDEARANQLLREARRAIKHMLRDNNSTDSKPDVDELITRIDEHLTPKPLHRTLKEQLRTPESQGAPRPARYSPDDNAAFAFLQVGNSR
jgi:hypothetical protein